MPIDIGCAAARQAAVPCARSELHVPDVGVAGRNGQKPSVAEQLAWRPVSLSATVAKAYRRASISNARKTSWRLGSGGWSATRGVLPLLMRSKICAVRPFSMAPIIPRLGASGKPKRFTHGVKEPRLHPPTSVLAPESIAPRRSKCLGNSADKNRNTIRAASCLSNSSE